MAADIDRLMKMSDQHSAQRDSITTALLKALLAILTGFSGWDSPTLRAGSAAQSANLVDAAVHRARLLQRSYLAAVLKDMGALPERLPTMLDGYPRSGVTGQTAYSRPLEQYIYRRRNGGTSEESFAAAERRMTSLASTDVYTAGRNEARDVFSASPKVTGYRRIIHPELSRTGTCGLCVVAADRVYHRAELLPIHDGENCDVLPITADDDPGFHMNAGDLEKVYAAAGSTFAAELLNTRITINEHGELGPVLVKYGDHFQTAEDVGAPTFRRRTAAEIAANRESELAQIADLLVNGNAEYSDFLERHPQSSWTLAGDEQQRAFELQRALGQLNIRQSQLRALQSRA